MTNAQFLALARELCQRYGFSSPPVEENATKIDLKLPSGPTIRLSVNQEAGRWSEYRYLMVQWVDCPSEYKPSFAWHGLMENDTVYPESIECAIRTSLLNPRALGI